MIHQEEIVMLPSKSYKKEEEEETIIMCSEFLIQQGSGFLDCKVLLW